MDSEINLLKRSMSLQKPANSHYRHSQPQLLKRFSTKILESSISPGLSPILPVYNPAPKPSKMLLDYINSTSAKGDEVKQIGGRSGNLGYRKKLDINAIFSRRNTLPRFQTITSLKTAGKMNRKVYRDKK